METVVLLMVRLVGVVLEAAVEVYVVLLMGIVLETMVLLANVVLLLAGPLDAVVPETVAV